MSTDIKLTPAEVEYIKAKRETEEAEALVLQKKKDELFQKELLEREKYIANDRLLERAQHAAAQGFIVSFPKGWTIKYVPYTKQYVIHGDYLNKENPKECNWEREKLWEKTEDFTEAHIVKGTYDIRVFPVDTSYRSGHPAYMDMSSISYEFRKKYTKVKTVIKKINELEESVAFQAAAKVKAANATEQLKAKLATMFPDTEIKFDTEWKNNYSGYRRRRGSSGYEIKVFTVTLKNGSSMKCRYYDDLSLGIERLHVVIPKLDAEKDPLKKLQIMNALNF